MDADDWEELKKERAAVYEFDGKLTRAESERRAAEDVEKLKAKETK